MGTSEHGPTPRPGPIRRAWSLVRSWFFGGGCGACRSHEDDLKRWGEALDERYGKKDAKADDHLR